MSDNKLSGRGDHLDKYWRANWQREVEGAYLYGKLAALATVPEERDALTQMAAQEQEHASVWAGKVHSVEPSLAAPQPDLRIHMIALLARWLGVNAVLGLLIHDEDGPNCASCQKKNGRN